MARKTSQANLRVQQEQDHDDVTPGDEDNYRLADPSPDPLLTVRKPTRNPIIVPTPPSPTRQSFTTEAAETPTPSGGYQDLVARTQRSMAGYEAARQKAQLERRRSLKKAKMPATPANQRAGGFPPLGEDDEDEGVGNTTTLIVEELLEEGKDNDYEAVFMSRPKIATSPIGTPAGGRRYSWGWE